MDVSKNKELERSVASVAVAFGLRVSGLPEDITRCRMGYDGRLVHSGDSPPLLQCQLLPEYMFQKNSC